ncbi:MULTISPECIES: hypothetical protein [unclassified Novosphingobium]|uniref:hypothetical protein n=1 Tax=unclassified Novosphingobium TaxID=2644732 RepID=UPI00146EF1ED|nr:MULTISPECIES: hypothetical protein [unclassified Novosphingobium]NMN07655.1 hypothetical protein [Novosphingobium sp. SG919]NMN89965.1 hypothetical protein [Novosphingobium sp. SG916]
MTAKIERIFPRWAQTLGALHHSNALVRSQCRCCGVQLRVDTEALALKHGATASLIDRSDRCSLVACSGSVFYLAARTYGRQWLSLVSREELLRGLEEAAPACNAQSLNLQRVKRPSRTGKG